MNIETVEDLAEKIADWMGIYGSCKNTHPRISPHDEEDGENKCTYNKSEPFCCRQGFTGAMQERIIESVHNTQKVEELFKKVD